MLERRIFFTAVLAAVLALAGCVGAPGGPASPTSDTDDPPESTTADTDTPEPRSDTEVEWPEGPKERPDRPAEWSESVAREFVQTHEYRHVYNGLWYGPATDVTLECEVDDSEPVADGYEVTVSCTGYSNTKTVVEEGGTPVEMHADYFTQTYTYYVDEDSIVRNRADE
jgi:hypothetical protein